MDMESLQKLRFMPSPSTPPPNTAHIRASNVKPERIIDKFEAEFDTSMKEKERRQARRAADEIKRSKEIKAKDEGG